jgi:hypothetical protein
MARQVTRPVFQVKRAAEELLLERRRALRRRPSRLNSLAELGPWRVSPCPLEPEPNLLHDTASGREREDLAERGKRKRIRYP